jgi:hypothetical protein
MKVELYADEPAPLVLPGREVEDEKLLPAQDFDRDFASGARLDGLDELGEVEDRLAADGSHRPRESPRAPRKPEVKRLTSGWSEGKNPRPVLVPGDDLESV